MGALVHAFMVGWDNFYLLAYFIYECASTARPKSPNGARMRGRPTLTLTTQLVLHPNDLDLYPLHLSPTLHLGMGRLRVEPPKLVIRRPPPYKLFTHPCRVRARPRPPDKP